jgi:hypothetical protein
MTPGTGTVVAEATESQTALRTASDAYCDNTEEKGWVAKAGNLFGLARLLMHGDRDGGVSAAPEYAEQIGAGTVESSIVFTRIARDADAARRGLAAVSAEARTLLATDEAGIADRTDVMSYERALVNAQKSYRSFAEAADIASSEVMTTPAETDDALTGLATEIDDARVTADQLANQYASLTRSVS